MGNSNSKLRPTWFQPDLFGDDWLTCRITIHLREGSVPDQVGVEVTNSWTDEVIALVVESLGKSPDADDVACHIAALVHEVIELYRH